GDLSNSFFIADSLYTHKRLSGLTDNNNENANLLIIAYQYFSFLIPVFTIKNTATHMSGIFVSGFYGFLRQQSKNKNQKFIGIPQSHHL
ncbi:hypothetical protein ACT3TI_02945, partial [Psychrobacter sp. AOP22-C1-22]|uniref:hypothetical protein n=1 Tax=unclassified Psychrobacter TaxID=196806 RepID=UPI0040380E4C